MPAITPPQKTYVRQRAVLPPDRHTLQFSFYIPLHFQYFYFLNQYFYFLNLLLSAIQRFYFTLFSHNYSLIADYTIRWLSVFTAVKIAPFFGKKREISSPEDISPTFQSLYILLFLPLPTPPQSSSPSPPAYPPQPSTRPSPSFPWRPSSGC